MRISHRLISASATESGTWPVSKRHHTFARRSAGSMRVLVRSNCFKWSTSGYAEHTTVSISAIALTSPWPQITESMKEFSVTPIAWLLLELSPNTSDRKSSTDVVFTSTVASEVLTVTPPTASSSQDKSSSTTVEVSGVCWVTATGALPLSAVSTDENIASRGSSSSSMENIALSNSNYRKKIQ